MPNLLLFISGFCLFNLKNLSKYTANKLIALPNNNFHKTYLRISHVNGFTARYHNIAEEENV